MEDEIDRKIRLSEPAHVSPTEDDVNIRECICEAYLRECQQTIDEGCELNKQVSCRNAPAKERHRSEHEQQSTIFRGGGSFPNQRSPTTKPNRTSVKNDAKESDIKVPNHTCHATCNADDPTEPVIEDCAGKSARHNISRLQRPTPAFKLKHLNLSGCFQVTDVGLR